MALANFKQYIMRTALMPAIFVGHGNPMNAIVDNGFTQGWETVARHIPKPRFIVCISAHWETQGTKITYSASPRTIHDFGGFPKALFDMEYPAPGSPKFADEIITAYGNNLIAPDQCWGLDHGAWTVMHRMYPDANIPVLEISLNYNLSPKEHFNFAKQLAEFRQKGALIIGSGNIVHNLGAAQWDRTDGYDWAINFDHKVKETIKSRDFEALLHPERFGKEGALSVPTLEHYLPLLYVLSLASDEKITFFNEEFDLRSISMTSVLLHGRA